MAEVDDAEAIAVRVVGIAVPLDSFCPDGHKTLRLSCLLGRTGYMEVQMQTRVVLRRRLTAPQRNLGSRAASRWGEHRRPSAETVGTDLIAERLAEAEAVASVGSKGDSYDNAMAEALNSLFKAECIRNPVMRPKGGWKSVSDVEIAVAEYIDWFNHRRLHGEIGLIPPAEFETNHWAAQATEHYRENPVLIEVGSN